MKMVKFVRDLAEDQLNSGIWQHLTFIIDEKIENEMEPIHPEMDSKDLTRPFSVK